MSWARLPEKDWIDLAHILIHHGRAICAARSPKYTVQVISGAEKGKRGRVLRVLFKVKGADGKKRIDADGGQIVVQGINLRYKHIKRSQKYPQGGRIQKEMPVNVSNVMLVDTSENRPVRTRVDIDKNGKKSRVSVKSGKAI